MANQVLLSHPVLGKICALVDGEGARWVSLADLERSGDRISNQARALMGECWLSLDDVNANLDFGSRREG